MYQLLVTKICVIIINWLVKIVLSYIYQEKTPCKKYMWLTVFQKIFCYIVPIIGRQYSKYCFSSLMLVGWLSLYYHKQELLRNCCSHTIKIWKKILKKSFTAKKNIYKYNHWWSLPYINKHCQFPDLFYMTCFGHWRLSCRHHDYISNHSKYHKPWMMLHASNHKGELIT